MNPLPALLGFVTLNPTYIIAVLSRNAKPNNGRLTSVCNPARSEA
ncbi:hypothetical protein D1AOALGA4SA_10714 [Olavius algarvensis Delta 1 endosymbiont]|nr:hypothetical protein D1AOALGA4SA_10714 [Olavius algarvensis Delta 1 endosymbiont]